MKQSNLNLPMIIVQHLSRDGAITFDAAMWASPKKIADGIARVMWPLYIVREVKLRRDGSTRTAVHIRPEKEE